MLDNKTTQYTIMNGKTEYGYVPNYDELIQNAPNEDMKKAWIESKEFHTKMLESDFPRASAFTFNAIYMMKMSCGHYEIFQHHARNEDELVEWINSRSEKRMRCTRCICG